MIHTGPMQLSEEASIQKVILVPCVAILITCTMKNFKAVIVARW
jgi:hypothetical protein